LRLGRLLKVHSGHMGDSLFRAEVFRFSADPIGLMPARSMVSVRSRFLVGTTENERYPNREIALMLPIVIM
jgi:hypothetical protein